MGLCFLGELKKGAKLRRILGLTWGFWDFVEVGGDFQGIGKIMALIDYLD